MAMMKKSLMATALAALAALTTLAVDAAQSKLPEGILEHGVASPSSVSRGIVTSRNAAGENLLLCLLADVSGCRNILEINIDSGKSRTIELPGAAQSISLSPFSSLRSSRGRYYSTYGGRFFEYDPKAGNVTFTAKCSGQLGMSMTEDKKGVIWAVSYPGSQLCSYNPESGEFTDYGSVHTEDWPQYQRYIAVDDAGWVYFGVGNVETQIVGFHPATRKSVALMPADQRAKGATAEVAPDRSGKVYGWNRGNAATPYFELFDGKAKELAAKPELVPAETGAVTGSQTLCDRVFPDGRKIKEISLEDRRLVVVDAEEKNQREITFDYPSSGSHVMSVAATGDGLIRGGAMHPMRYFVFNPASGEFIARGNAQYQWNALLAHKEHLYIGGYGGGALLDWKFADQRFDPIGTKPEPKKNPRHFGEGSPELHRPSMIVMTPDEKRVVMAGTPGYGRTGGGLVIFDRGRDAFEIVKHGDLLGSQSAQSLLPLSNTQLLVGGTVAAGTGGRVEAKAATLAIYDLDVRKVIWNEEIVPGVDHYPDMIALPDGKVLVCVGRDRLGIFNPATRKIEKLISTGDFGAFAWQQGPRILHRAGDRWLVLFGKAIAEFDPKTAQLTKLVELPFTITAGGAVLNDRIYFASGAVLYSYQY
jgi:hypothetical protein